MTQHEYTDGFGDKMTIQNYMTNPGVTITIEGPNGSSRNVLLPPSETQKTAQALLEMCGQGVPEVDEEVEEYTTYYFTHTRNGRTNEVNGVHRVEFKRHFVLFYGEQGRLVLAERQEDIAELRQGLAA